jgi:hypothetical protein
MWCNHPEATRTNVLKLAGAWMTDCGASSESARNRTGSDVFRREGWGCTRLAAPPYKVATAARTLAWLSVLAGLTMSSRGDLMWMSLPSSSLGGFTCASSSICGRVSAVSRGVSRRQVPQFRRCHCCRLARGRRWRDRDWAGAADGPRWPRTCRFPLALLRQCIAVVAEGAPVGEDVGEGGGRRGRVGVGAERGLQAGGGGRRHELRRGGHGRSRVVHGETAP